MSALIRALLLAIVLIGSAHANDTVWLKSGDRVSGKLEVMDNGTLRITTEWGGPLLIDRAAVESVTTERSLNLALPDGERTDARLARDDSGGQLIVTDEGSEALALSDIRIASVAPVREATRNRWETRATYGLNLSSGNSETESHSLRANSLLRRDAFRHAVNADFDLKKDDGAKTREIFRVGYQLDWFFREDWFAFGSSEYFQDELRDVDLRVTLGAGIGHQFWENSLGAFSIESGISEVIEDIAGERENSRAVRLAMDYKRFFFGQTMSLFHRNELLALADRDRGELLRTSTGLRYQLNSFLATDFRIDLDYETEPAPGRKNADVTYIIGLGFTW